MNEFSETAATTPSYKESPAQEPIVLRTSVSPAERAPEEDVEMTALVPGGGMFQRMSEVEPKAVDWLIPGLIPNKEVTLLCGDGGVGKSMFTALMTTYVTTGRATELFQNPLEHPGNVVLLSGEDPLGSMLKPRLKAAGADERMVLAASRENLTDETGRTLDLSDEALWTSIQSANPSLVVIDPIQSFLPLNVRMNDRQKMRALIQNLQAEAKRGGFTILMVVHTNKGANTSGRNRVSGTGDLWDAARSVMLMGCEKGGSRVYLSHEKSNYGACAETALFTVETVEIDGMQTSRLVFDEMTERKDADFVREKPEKGDEKGKKARREIVSLLTQAPDGKMESVALMTAVMSRVGCKESTYNHARSDLANSRFLRNERSGRRGKCYTVLNRGALGEGADLVCPADAS